ncbi:hypothetical protein E2C01_081805 [Portunus trituberculatus]|uniref:Uncharacterized protein n=1 Tax=Portunus trituberculatus TaxID=210409 RepID=A0A5B7IQR3_PORTR|nr:hypothetical protein [Portunus trituberculatus]
MRFVAFTTKATTAVLLCGREDLWILMTPGVVLCGYHRRGSSPVFLKKAQVRRRIAGYCEGRLRPPRGWVDRMVECDGQGGEP